MFVALGTPLISPRLLGRSTPRIMAAGVWDQSQRRDDESESDAAYHEAGHAVIALVLGVEVRSVEIRKGPWETSADAKRLTHIPTWWQLAYHDFLAIALAGEVSRCKFRGVRYGWGNHWGGLGDEFAVESVLRDPQDIPAAQVRVEQLLTRNWSHVEALAAALLKYGHLDARFLDSFVARQKLKKI